MARSDLKNASSSEPALPGAAGQAVSLMLVGVAGWFMFRFAYDAILTSSVVDALRVVAAALAVPGFGWLGFKLTARKAWWYSTAAVGILMVFGVVTFAIF